MITKRQFLSRLGAVGGYGTTFLAMQAMGLLPNAVANSGPPKLNRGAGVGTSVVILGAGIAGMTACYELSKAGYNCVILEARDRTGGRNWTIRNGDRVIETVGDEQVCDFDNGLYFNAGPARIPSQHRALLGYCKEFGVALEVFVNSNRSALFQDDKAFEGRPIESRQINNDAAGHIMELLAKAVDRGALDEALGNADKRRLSDFFIQHGALDRDLTYRGSSRSGYELMPGAAFRKGDTRKPLDAIALLSSGFWYWQLDFEKRFDQQATMLQPVGGMDRIATAFEARVGEHIRLGCVVQQIRKTAEGVRIVYKQATDGASREVHADYCICTLPLSVLSELNADFSLGFKQAVKAGAGVYEPACKLAWQASRRFWEDDQGIYGGISWTQREITQLWYPSNGYHTDTGILIGAYNFSPQAHSFGKLSSLERARAARKSGMLLHPQMALEVAKPISVAWQNVPFSKGAYSTWDDRRRSHIYPTLNQPDDRIYLAGEHLSYWTSWQEGAVLSAHHVVGALDARVQASRG